MVSRGIKGFGWFLLGAIITPICYLVTSEIAQMRAQVVRVQDEIEKTRAEIRGLETEFATRAAMLQLERWNGEVLAYAAPRAAQFLPDDRALAALRPLEAGAPPIRYAALVVPSAVDAPAGQADAQVDRQTGEADAAAPVRAAPQPGERQVLASATASAAVRAPSPAPGAGARSGGLSMPRAVAMLDRQILSDSTLGDLVRAARAETAGTQ